MALATSGSLTREINPTTQGTFLLNLSRPPLGTLRRLFFDKRVGE